MKARTVVLPAAGVLVALVAYRVWQARKAAKTAAVAPASVALIRTEPVVRTNLAIRISFTGNIAADNDVPVFAKIGGRVDRLFVEVGARVRAGEVLATVEHQELSWQARAAQAQVLAAQAQVQVAEAGADGAKLEFTRTAELARGGSAPQAQLDGASVHLKLAKAQVALARANLAAAQAQAGLMGQELADTRIESPIDGVVTSRAVSLGAMVGKQVPAFTVQDLSTLKLDSTVDARQFGQLAVGMPAVVAVDASPEETFPGQVAVLAPALDPETRRAEVEIKIDNGSGRLLPNEFARATVTVGRLAGTLAVSTQALLEQAGGAVVFRVRSGKVEELHPTFGPTDGSLVAVRDGLAPGDLLAITGLGNLSDGAPVKVDPAPPAAWHR